MPDEHYLKEIATELKLIRKELQRMNNPLEPVEKIDTVNVNTLNINQVNANNSR